MANNDGRLTEAAMSQLIKLKELLDSGILTQEEFDAKKRQILGMEAAPAAPVQEKVIQDLPAVSEESAAAPEAPVAPETTITPAAPETETEIPAEPELPALESDELGRVGGLFKETLHFPGIVHGAQIQSSLLCALTDGLVCQSGEHGGQLKDIQ